jgi:hypothetical protein
MRSPGRRAHSFRDLLIETKSSMLFFSGGIDIYDEIQIVVAFVA